MDDRTVAVYSAPDFPKIPFSLHDCRIEVMEAADDTLTLRLPDGFVHTEAPYPKVPGAVEITGVDWDFASVTLGPPVSAEDVESYTAQSLTVQEFITRFPDFSIEITDEYYGWHKALYTGWLSAPGLWVRLTLTLAYFKGGIRYLTEGENAP